MPRCIKVSQWQRRLLVAFAFLCCAAALHASTISGTVKDSSGALIPQALVEINGGDLPAAVVLSSDGTGRFVSADLKPGTYLIRITKDGFEPHQQSVDLHESIDIEITLPVAHAQIGIEVPGLATAFTNTDPTYKKLRDLGIGESLRLDHCTLTWDVGTFHFDQGILTFLSPVEGVVTGAIFIGEGHFNLKPVLAVDVNEVRRRTGTAEVDEDFTEVVFRFTRNEHRTFLRYLGGNTQSPEAPTVLKRWREKVRERREYPLGFSQYLLEGETVDNVDADILASIYNPAHPPFLNAYIHGKKHKDLRFFIRVRVGALPQLDSPEEVALVNFDPEAMNDGVWYLSHLKSEHAKHVATSVEDRRLFATHRYKIETVIARNEHLFSSATVAFEPLVAGERVLKFGLLPNLRVSRVLDAQGQNLYFIQESRKADGSFYVILPKAPEMGMETSITIEYAGDKVLDVAGQGSFYVQARTAWYPNLNGFGEHALFDLTFKVPRNYKVISVGRLESESVEQELAVSHWVTPIPVAVAGFNIGAYTKLDISDEITNYHISAYYLSELPDNLRQYRALESMAPKSMTKYALSETRAQLQLCTYYFGKIPYEDISITEQPNFAFGQSWPNLVYLPISAYIDSTQRWMLFGRIDNKFTGFVREVTPHEVAHQWWGHAVGWASYHDQWLSEGFAEFSAALFLQKAFGNDSRKDWLEFWQRLHDRILEKNNFGVAANDAGPLWLGLRLISPTTQDAYQNVTYPKGAYVLEMLRSLMYTAGEQPFIDMMHDFVESHKDHAASTESFKAIAEKHITKEMDLENNGRLDWFFNEWVYGTDVPRYHFEYQTSAAEGGKVKLHMTITQSEVGEHFAMRLPVYADFGKGWIRLGQIGVLGNSTHSVDSILPSLPKKVALNAYKEVLER